MDTQEADTGTGSFHAVICESVLDGIEDCPDTYAFCSAMEVVAPV